MLPWWPLVCCGEYARRSLLVMAQKAQWSMAVFRHSSCETWRWCNGSIVPELAEHSGAADVKDGPRTKAFMRICPSWCTLLLITS